MLPLENQRNQTASIKENLSTQRNAQGLLLEEILVRRRSMELFVVSVFDVKIVVVSCQEKSMVRSKGGIAIRRAATDII